MKVKMDKESLNKIEAAFDILIKDHSSSVAVGGQIAKELANCFSDYTFNVMINLESENLYGMSVYPEVSTLDKVVSAVAAGKTDMVKQLWEKNKVWTVEIDMKLITIPELNCDEKEMTAMLLHEVGHIVCSNSIPQRINNILSYEIVKSSFNTKALLKDKIFRTIMALPILDCCVSNGKSNKELKKEISADNFVKKSGYSAYLIKVLDKLIAYNKKKSSMSTDKKMKDVAQFSLKTIEDFQARRDNLAKKGLFALKAECSSPFIESVIDTCINTLFVTEEGASFDKNAYMHEKADKIVEGELMQEFFIFRNKQLKRIDRNDIDYIAIKIQGIKTETDKLMIVSYINSKMDMVDYYLSILKNPETARKYRVPHTIPELEGMRKALFGFKEQALKVVVRERPTDVVLVSYPAGYEG